MEKTSRESFTFIDNVLHIDGVSIDKLTQNHKTPFYLYSKNQLQRNLNFYKEAIADSSMSKTLICFALKANNHPDILRFIAQAGLGADVVSGGELNHAIAHGIPAHKIVFSGVGKTTDEIENGIRLGIKSFNVESIDELEEINNMAKELGMKANIAIRYNPEVKARTHHFISTGYKTHKFGLLEKDLSYLVNNMKTYKYCTLKGLAIHIGSQLTDLSATNEAVHKMCKLAKNIPELEFLDVGGGLGVSYHPDDKAPLVFDYIDGISQIISSHGLDHIEIVFEPGRRLVATTSVLISQVLRLKESDGHNFIILDAGMNDFARPSLYSAYHKVEQTHKKLNKPLLADVVGPICESTDCFGTNREFNNLNKGDYVMIWDTGAYGRTMASNYNMRPATEEIFI